MKEKPLYVLQIRESKNDPWGLVVSSVSKSEETPKWHYVTYEAYERDRHRGLARVVRCEIVVKDEEVKG